MTAWIACSTVDVTRPYFRDVGVTLGAVESDTLTVHHQGRSFTYDVPDAVSVEQLLAKVDTLARPGERLFVGPQDMRRTPYNDDSIYVLLPTLVPATSFPDMHPGVALNQGAQLAADVQSADILVLTSQFSNWNEPNDSRLYGSDLANQIVTTEFCPRAQIVQFTVLTRC